MANWKKVETGGDIKAYWPGKANDRKEGMSTEGNLVEKREITRPDGAKDFLWVLKNSNGELVGVNNAAGLNRAMETITMGSLVRITFLGKKMGNKGRQFNDFQVDVAETAEASDTASEDTASKKSEDIDLTGIPF